MPNQVCKTFTMSATVNNAKIKLKSIENHQGKWDGQDGASGDNHSLCAGMLTLVGDQ